MTRPYFEKRLGKLDPEEKLVRSRERKELTAISAFRKCQGRILKALELGAGLTRRQLLNRAAYHLYFKQALTDLQKTGLVKKFKEWRALNGRKYFCDRYYLISQTPIGPFTRPLPIGRQLIDFYKAIIKRLEKRDFITVAMTCNMMSFQNSKRAYVYLARLEALNILKRNGSDSVFPKGSFSLISKNSEDIKKYINTLHKEFEEIEKYYGNILRNALIKNPAGLYMSHVK